MEWNSGEGTDDRVDGGADRTTRELEGPKETTRENREDGRGRKSGQSRKGTNGERAADGMGWNDEIGDAGAGEKGVLTALGALDKGGVGRSVDEGSG